MRKLLLYSGLSLLTSLNITAQAQQNKSLGQISGNLMEPLSVFTGTAHNICLVLGIAFLAGALIQYKNHRDNPSQAPISRSIFLLIFGLVLVALPLIGKLSDSAELLS